MTLNTVRNFLFILLVHLFSGSLSSQVTAARNDNLNGESDSIIKSFESRDWQQMERLQKEQFLRDKNPSRLVWSARCCIWKGDTACAFFYLDTAIKCGYANIYVLDRDTAFSSVRQTQHWSRLRDEIGAKYEIKEGVFLWGYYYGVLAIIFILNLFLFLSTKEYSYLFLGLMLLADMHLELFNNSSQKIFVTRIVPWLSTVMATRFPPPTFYVAAMMIFYLLFSKAFLRVREHLPRLVVVYRTLIVLFACIIFVRFQWGLLPDLVIQMLVAASFLLIVLTGILQWRRGMHQSVYFVMAALVITIGFFVNELFVVIAYSPLSIGMMIAFTILTIGIGNKVKLMRIEKERAQEKAMEALEEKVAERTAEVVRQKNEISEQKNLVEEKQKEIVDSITYAKRLQQAILPPAEFIDQRLPDNFVLFLPKDIVAGDFYWAEEVNGLLFISAADSTGHGVPGAMVSVVCSNALNRSIKEFKLTDTGKILDKTRELVVETFEKSGADVKDGMDASLLCFDKKSGKVYWSGANNPLWYLQDNTLHEIRGDKQPVGKTDNGSPFTTHEIGYKVGTTFYLFTDGLADQFGGPKGKKFKYKQFEELLVSIQHLPMQRQLNEVLNKFEQWKGGLEQVDDICVVALKI